MVQKFNSWKYINTKFDDKDFEILHFETNGNPLQVKLICNTLAKDDCKTLLDSLKKYFSTSKYEIELANTAFKAEKQSTQDINDFTRLYSELLALLNVNRTIPSFLDGTAVDSVINRHYMFYDPEKSIIVTLFPAAAYYFGKLRTYSDIEHALKALLFVGENQTKLTHDTIGRLIEYYIIEKLKLEDKKPAREMNLQYTDERGHEHTLKLKWTMITFIEQEGYVPKEFIHCNQILIPNNPNYPCVDLIYYDTDKKTLYVFQITVNFENHKKSHEEFKYYFTEYWQKTIGNDIKFVFIWVGGNWNPNQYSKIISHRKSVTPGSFTMTYSQFNPEVFTLFRDLVERGDIIGLGGLYCHLPLFKKNCQLGNISNNDTVKTRIQEFLAEKEVNTSFDLYLLKSDQLSWKKGDALLQFKEETDQIQFRSKFKETTMNFITKKDFENTKLKIISAYHILFLRQ
jgi:hypothetical protein